MTPYPLPGARHLRSPVEHNHVAAVAAADADGLAPRLQFKIRTMLVITALVRVLLTALSNLPGELVSGGLLAIVIGYALWLCNWVRWFRLPLAALLACLYLPFSWIVTWRSLADELPRILLLGAGLPAFFESSLLGWLFRQRPQSQQFWLALLLTAFELWLGLWLIRLGPKRTIAYLIVLLISSIYGSFVLNAFMRM